ncbi:hypothetical protein JQ604_09965 [Bradyrhizobium jicamae]|uniref:beta family protein n=1 Tax=Bradyrhizobium jicamae TaxID=280332 RepID=UPI001BADD232|nr:hypothetical protein [Bradyrhizobium jicamae]MBR0752512.1 hypothetical protein [Bradyrhizobium jicamae]
MPFTYRPLLKTKTGEAVALLQLSTEDKDRIEPIFSVGEKPPANFIARMGAAWQGRRCFLDGSFNYNVTGGPSDFDTMFAGLGGAGIAALPVIEIGALANYNLAAFAHRGQFAPGLMLKCTHGHLSSAAGWAQQMGLQQAQIDLLVDAGHVAEFDPTSFGGYIGHILANNLQGSNWRSVTLATSAAPKDFGQLALGTSLIPRNDWLTWTQIQQTANPIDFGDFGISHRDLAEPPGVAMAGATVSVRYTIDGAWVMIKGRRITGPTGVAMGDQYRQHAQTLFARPDFDRLPNCWGDQRITTIATDPTASAGGRAQWVEISANRHFAFIASTLP